MADFPTALTNAVDGATDVLAKHLNNLEAKVGIDSSAVTTSHDYKLSGVTGSDKAASKAGSETITNKTINAADNTLTDTSAALGDLLVHNGTRFVKRAKGSALQQIRVKSDGSDLEYFTPASSGFSNFNGPEGFLINGKIVPSVASNNLTVAIKGMDGNDPSASNPVYIRIGDAVRTISSALSVTKNAGTNYCNSGSSEFATKEVDYFVYIGYNATDGVVVGFSRIPYATIYSDFSTTATAETYCAISTITNAAAGDNYIVVGRFAATLSAGAGYTWTVPTFTSLNLIQRPVRETRWLTYVTTASGFTSAPDMTSRYLIRERTVTVVQWFNATPTSNSTSTSFTAPMAAKTITNGLWRACGRGSNNSTQLTTPISVELGSGSSTINTYKDMAGAAWTNANGKLAEFTLIYEI